LVKEKEIAKEKRRVEIGGWKVEAGEFHTVPITKKSCVALIERVALAIQNNCKSSAPDVSTKTCSIIPLMDESSRVRQSLLNLI
jgi:hypothetical protein